MKSGECVIRDDANSITEQIKQADVIVWATPIYYYEKSGQMKVMIDRANSLYETDYQFRDVYLLSTAAENEDGVDHRAINGLKDGLRVILNLILLEVFLLAGLMNQIRLKIILL